MPYLVLVRHGQSLWNQQNRFTGWVDVPLTELGRREAREGADAIRHIKFDVAYTSALRRAQDTLALLTEALGQSQVPVIRDQALNERDYGELSGLNKAETAAKHGEAQVHIWRRSFDVAPPGGESLMLTAERTLPFFERAIEGDIRIGHNVLVVAHGNSNRAIVMKLEKISREDIADLELPTGIPRVYEYDAKGAVHRRMPA
jgi:2,3-bisphosphoglycerate-dependent phosphoglycerate mutase